MHIKLTNGVPTRYTVGQLRRDNPQVSFPKDIPPGTLAQFGVFPLSATDRPPHNELTHKVVEGTPAQVNGAWLQVWDTVALTQGEVAEKLAQIQEDIVDATQQRLDDFARTKGYDGILSACTYATSPTATFAAEGQYCVAQRDATWAKLYQVLGEVQANLRPMPTGYSDIEAELPALDWGDV